MGDEDPSKLNAIGETDPIELEKHRARTELAWETREMTANLLRVIRGAGKPHLLPQQIINLGGAILEIHKEVRAWAIWSAMEDTLQSAAPDRYGEPEHDAHIGTIARGSLQFLASRLVYQQAQRAAGEREIAEGIRELERYREEQRANFYREQAEARAALARPSKKPQPKKQSKSATQPDAEAEPPEPAPKTTAEFMKARQKQLRGED
jgi:hypothetical protein